jgi:two-component system sensor histidine kinase BaeS
VRRLGSLTIQVFLAILTVAMAAVLVAGLVARYTARAAFEVYLSMPTGPMAGYRHLVFDAAAQQFLDSVDLSIWIGMGVALVLAAVGGLLLARYLTAPLERVTSAAQRLAEGERDVEVEPGGPEEVVRLGAAFNDMSASLTRSEALRRRLVGDVAHELRNPIAAIRAQTEGIRDGVLEPDSGRIDSIIEDVEHLGSLVGDLQELSVADAGALSYDMADIDLRGLLAREAERARGLVRDDVEVMVDCPAGITVHGDERRILQVVRNLVSNAARHTQVGRLTLRAFPADGDEVAVEVADTGEGIPDSDLPFIFERFYRADAARSRDTGGAGIGLAISRRIVEDHGGAMFARSTPGQGTVVGFTLPGRARS